MVQGHPISMATRLPTGNAEFGTDRSAGRALARRADFFVVAAGVNTLATSFD
jgi:hypothetical protein